MSKRFHDTEIWGEDWFVAIPKDYRDFWLYVKDKCDHAGIYRPNIAIFNKLYDCQVQLKKALEYFNMDKQRIRVLSNGRWFLEDFLTFQYGNHLNPKSRMHFSVLQILDKNGIKLDSIRGQVDLNLRLSRGQVEDTYGPKDKDKDKDNKRTTYYIAKFDFEDIWEKYPNCVGKKKALKHFKATVKTEKDYQNIQKALENYIKSDRVKKGYIQNGSTWFNDWEQWVEQKSKERPYDPDEMRYKLGRITEEVDSEGDGK